MEFYSIPPPPPPPLNTLSSFFAVPKVESPSRGRSRRPASQGPFGLPSGLCGTCACPRPRPSRSRCPASLPTSGPLRGSFPLPGALVPLPPRLTRPPPPPTSPHPRALGTLTARSQPRRPDAALCWSRRRPVRFALARPAHTARHSALLGTEEGPETAVRWADGRPGRPQRGGGRASLLSKAPRLAGIWARPAPGACIAAVGGLWGDVAVWRVRGLQGRLETSEGSPRRSGARPSVGAGGGGVAAANRLSPVHSLRGGAVPEGRRPGPR